MLHSSKYSFGWDFKMDVLNETPVLKFNPNTLQEVRSLYDLNKPGRMEEAIKLLEDWIQKQEHFKCKKFGPLEGLSLLNSPKIDMKITLFGNRTDRDYLERLIINNKGLTERAKSKLDKMCTFRSLLPEYFYCDIREIMNIPHFRDAVSETFMTKMTPENYRVFVLKYNNYLTPEIISASYKISFLYAEYVAKHDYAAGVIFVNDLRYINILDLISKINLTELKKVFTVVQEGYSMRIKGIHYLTDSKFVESLVNLWKTILAPKIIQRVYCHSNLESLYQRVPKEILCTEYGGQEGSLDDLRNLWIDVLNSEENKDYMKIVNERRIDESKRIGEKISDLYLPGSFRTLSVD